MNGTSGGAIAAIGGLVMGRVVALANKGSTLIRASDGRNNFGGDRSRASFLRLT